MKSGKWIPLCKALVSALPRGGRPFTKLEAMFSLTLDYDNGSPVTVSGYASLWSWSERQVRRFLEEVGVAICYPQNTRSRQNQRGEISVVIPEGNRRESGEIKIIDSKGLASETERKRREAGEKAERSASATKEPDPDPEPKGKRFVPPSLEEVRAYCHERQNGVDPQRWLDHYQSNGWMVGKNRMKDWRAAVRTWEGGGQRGGGGSPRRFSVTGGGRRDAGITEDGRF